MRNNLISLLFLLIYFVGFNGYAKSNYLEIVNQSSNSITIKASFPEPKLIQTGKEKEEYFFIGNTAILQEEGFPAVPYISEIFSLPGTTVNYRIIEIVTRERRFQNYLVNLKSINQKTPYPALQSRDKEFVYISYKGLFRDTPVFSLTIFPVKVNLAGKKAICISTITLEIFLSGPSANVNQLLPQVKPLKERALLNKCLLNNVNNAVKFSVKPVKQPAGESFKSGRIKLMINEDGLYKISYDDLIQAGIDPGQYNTKKLRLLNKGKEIPVYFKGAADGKFDSGDYFEFWGEMNKSAFTKKYPDVYTDPFSDINVYWLESSGQNGLRMVEESGALVDNYLYIPYQFTETVHFEQNNSFDRLGHETANRDSLAYTVDHWFFDQGISNGGKKSYYGWLAHPAETGMNSVYLKVMMRGKSFYNQEDNPIENHLVSILLNDAAVASTEGSIWRDQTSKLIGNTQGISQSVLHHGNNELIVYMNQPQVTDIVLLNWYEIEYQRKYRADNNFLKFKKQQLGIPPSTKFQFEIDGFTHNKIEIYKLGIS
jgi:hypothetical protein